MEYESPLRGTGRTTRMLARAMRLARAGEHVIVIGYSEQHAHCLFEVVAMQLSPEDLAPGRGRGPDTLSCGDGSISFYSAIGISFDWREMRIRGRRCKTLIDHSAIEKQFDSILAELHRYDVGDSGDEAIPDCVRL